MEISWKVKSSFVSVLFLLTSCATTASVESVTLKYQHPGVGSHHQYLLFQGIVYNVIDDDFQLSTDARTESGIFFTDTVTAVPKGFRVAPSIEGWESGDRAPALKIVNLTLKNQMNDAELDRAFDAFMKLNPPNYIVNAEGKSVEVLVTDAYKNQVRAIASDMINNADELTAETKKRYIELFNETLDELNDDAYLQYAERFRTELNALNGVTLKLNGEPVKGVTLFKQRPDDHHNAKGTLQFTGYSACRDQTASQNCIVLKHVARPNENSKKFIGNTETTLVVDPDNLRVHSAIRLARDKAIGKMFAEQWVLPLAISTQLHLTNEIDEAELEQTRRDMAKVGGFVPREADWEDFVQVYGGQISDLMNVLDCAPMDGDVNSKGCTRLRNVYTSEKLMKKFSHYEQLGTESNTTKEGERVLGHLNKLFMARVFMLAAFAVVDESKGKPIVDREEFMMKISEKAMPFIANSPITGKRHTDYLAKLKQFLQALPGTMNTGDRTPGPKR